MLQTLKLLLPAIIPSWRFFDVIAASPRIEYALLEEANDAPGTWREFRPRPERLSAADIIKRLFWNARRNETLFLVSCAERLMSASNDHSRDEIFNRIKAEHATAPYLRFRLVFLSRHDGEVRKDVTYVSPTLVLSGAKT